MQRYQQDLSTLASSRGIGMRFGPKPGRCNNYLLLLVCVCLSGAKNNACQPALQNNSPQPFCMQTSTGCLCLNFISLLLFEGVRRSTARAFCRWRRASRTFGHGTSTIVEMLVYSTVDRTFALGGFDNNKQQS